MEGESLNKIFDVGCLYVSCEGKNKHVGISATNLNGIEITNENKNKRIRIDIGLICSVGVGKYLYLQVTEGNLITVNNEYILVNKR